MKPVQSPTRSTTLAAACTALFCAPFAFGQERATDGSTQMSEVVVTGSNIRRVDAETASPIQVISQEEIERTGKTSIGEFLQTLTTDGAGSVPKTFGNGFASGGAGVSLRGLGAGSTLVLLNSRRIAPYGLADDGQKVFTDLSVIPLDVVQRVEVLKDGASAIYGSDAIAGVVNVTLKRDFQGVVAKGSFGSSRYSDGNGAKISAAAGFGNLADDRYNVFFNVELSDNDRIVVSDRKDRGYIGTGDLRAFGYSIGGSQFMSGSITPGNAASSPAGSVRDPATLQYQSLPGCAQFSDLPPDPRGGCLWDLGRFRDLTPEQKYVNGFTRGTFALTETSEVYTELGYSRKTSDFNNSPSGVSGSWGYPGGPVNASAGPGAVVLGATHPDNPYGVPVRLRYAAFDVGPRKVHVTNEFWRALVGAKATLLGWEVDTGYLHSESNLTNERIGFLRYSAVRAALADPTSLLYPWRIGDNANLNSADLYAAISPKIHSDGKTSLDLVDIKGSRTLAELPGGPLGVALGAEYRHLETSLTPQTYTDQGDIIGLGYSAYDGTQNVAGVYAEVLAPVIKPLELSAAVRSDHYMNGETSTTPKFGVKFRAFEQLALRASLARGFRAPNAAESGTGGLAAFANARDPVRCPNGVPAPGATDADCSVSVALITSPNPALKAEKSRSYTTGLVFEPAPLATFALDFFEIKRTNEINTETLTDAIARGATVRSDNLLNGQPGTGTLLAARADYINSAGTRVRGGDLDARYGFELGSLGKLTLDMQWTHISSFLRTEPDGSQLQFAGTHGNCDTTNCIGTPKNRINFGASWSMSSFNVSTVVNYVGSFENVGSAGETCANNLADGSPAPNADCRIASFYSIDLSGRWQPTQPLEVFATVANLFDRMAPLDPLTYGSVNYNPLHSAGAIGRYYTVGVRYTFD
jgi:iron complex outermembrane receptor protein